jgi:hypothetical protein
MKLKCEVTAVEKNGDSLQVRMQGSALGDAEWRPYLRFTIEIPITEKTKKSYFIGRNVDIDIKTK